MVEKVSILTIRLGSNLGLGPFLKYHELSLGFYQHKICEMNRLIYKIGQWEIFLNVHFSHRM